ncbi:unnamed protein product [Acanthoscelides obtectus]|uniref:Uncharacterized protein n=1 Tax=Acanthoscelides obtectus TaxID=200917 RepID=A0A9P0LE88_ACAOB|nr:unnamed protein product [Acanthoscelides obtectus]CAK1669537.1 hypothetical protein AOBTE_LOCUS27059 [Acanthoscelides obtectus]
MYVVISGYCTTGCIEYIKDYESNPSSLIHFFFQRAESATFPPAFQIRK